MEAGREMVRRALEGDAMTPAPVVLHYVIQLLQSDKEEERRAVSDSLSAFLNADLDSTPRLHFLSHQAVPHLSVTVFIATLVESFVSSARGTPLRNRVLHEICSSAVKEAFLLKEKHPILRKHLRIALAAATIPEWEALVEQLYNVHGKRGVTLDMPLETLLDLFSYPLMPEYTENNKVSLSTLPVQG